MFRDIRNPYKRSPWTSNSSRPHAASEAASRPPQLLRLLIAFGLVLLFLLGLRSHEAARSLRATPADEVYSASDFDGPDGTEAPIDEIEEAVAQKATFEEEIASGDDLYGVDTADGEEFDRPLANEEDSSLLPEMMEMRAGIDYNVNELETEAPTFEYDIAKADSITTPPSSEITMEEESNDEYILLGSSDSPSQSAIAELSTTTILPGKTFVEEELSVRDLLQSKSMEKRERLREQLEQGESERSDSDKSSPPIPSQEHTYGHPGRCDESDAFSGIPIDGVTPADSHAWIPPKGASIKSINEWEDSYKSAMKRIKESNLGGDNLRSFALSEVRGLKDLRHRLFCSN